MNRIKFYKRMPDDSVKTVFVKVTQSKRDLDREVRCKPSPLHPDGYRRIPNRLMTRAQACAAWLGNGFTRQKPKEAAA